MSGPNAEHIAAVARAVDPGAFNDPIAEIVTPTRIAEARDEAKESARLILRSTDPAVHAAMLDALTRHGVLTEEWAVQYETNLSAPTMDGQTERTSTTTVPSEARARAAIATGAPINARNRRVVRRRVTSWDVTS